MRASILLLFFALPVSANEVVYSAKQDGKTWLAVTTQGTNVEPQSTIISSTQEPQMMRMNGTWIIRFKPQVASAPVNPKYASLTNQIAQLTIKNDKILLERYRIEKLRDAKMKAGQDASTEKGAIADYNKQVNAIDKDIAQLEVQRMEMEKYLYPNKIR